ncbi:MAG: NERD domain-containing protein [Pseudomonadota bacterium]|nr:MAG: NERD domain-containing protein [Pseudomonadota bacterium]
MTETLAMLAEALSSDGARFALWAGALLLLAIALLMILPALGDFLEDSRYVRAICRPGAATYHHVLIPDGVGGTELVDHLSLLPHGIVVLMEKRYSGVIFAGEQIEEWTQLVGTHSYKFPNPLRHLEVIVSLVRNAAGTQQVSGRIVFAPDSEFPKGKPPPVSRLQELRGDLDVPESEAIPTPLQAAWDALIQGRGGDAQEAKPPLAIGAPQLRGKRRVYAGAVALVAALLLGVALSVAF